MMKQADELKILVMCYWRFTRGCPIVASEYNYGAADVLAVTAADMTIETEVKISISDLKKDGEKRKHIAMQRELGLLQEQEPRYPFIRAATRAHYFYFAVPEKLKDKAKQIVNEKYPYAGLLIVRPLESLEPSLNPRYAALVYATRKAPQFRSKPRLTYGEKTDVVKGMATTLCRMGMELLLKNK